MTTSPRSNTSQRVDLTPMNFENLVIQSGNNLQLERAIFCPCRRYDNNSWQSTCNVCHGSGYLFTQPIQVLGAITGLNYVQTTTVDKELINSTANFTLSELYDFRLNLMDKLTVLDGNGIIKNNLIQTKLISNNQNVEQLISTVPYKINSIEFIYLYYSNTNIVLLDSKTDYSFIDNKIIFSDIIKQKLKKAGMIETVASIRYYHKAIYHVIQTNHNIRQTNIMENGKESLKLLPLQYMIREATYDLKDYNVIL